MSCDPVENQIIEAIKELYALNRKIFSVAPHLTICSPQTQKIKEFMRSYPITPKEFSLLSKYTKESESKWASYEERGEAFVEKLKKHWLPIYNRLMLEIQDDVFKNKTPRLTYHLEDLNSI